MGKAFGLAISRSRVQILLEATLRNVVVCGSAGVCFLGFRRAAVSLLRSSMCVHAVDEDLVTVVDLGIILLGLDSGCVHDPLLHNASSRRFGCSVGV